MSKGLFIRINQLKNENTALLLKISKLEKKVKKPSQRVRAGLYHIVSTKESHISGEQVDMIYIVYPGGHVTILGSGQEPVQTRIGNVFRIFESGDWYCSRIGDL